MVSRLVRACSLIRGVGWKMRLLNQGRSYAARYLIMADATLLNSADSEIRMEEDPVAGVLPAFCLRGRLRAPISERRATQRLSDQEEQVRSHWPATAGAGHYASWNQWTPVLPFWGLSRLGGEGGAPSDLLPV
jgi:hypothetical protein